MPSALGPNGQDCDSFTFPQTVQPDGTVRCVGCGGYICLREIWEFKPSLRRHTRNTLLVCLALSDYTEKQSILRVTSEWRLKRSHPEVKTSFTEHQASEAGAITLGNTQPNCNVLNSIRLHSVNSNVTSPYIAWRNQREWAKYFFVKASANRINFWQFEEGTLFNSELYRTNPWFTFRLGVNFDLSFITI